MLGEDSGRNRGKALYIGRKNLKNIQSGEKEKLRGKNLNKIETFKGTLRIIQKDCCQCEG